MKINRKVFGARLRSVAVTLTGDLKHDLGRISDILKNEVRPYTEAARLVGFYRHRESYVARYHVHARGNGHVVALADDRARMELGEQGERK